MFADSKITGQSGLEGTEILKEMEKSFGMLYFQSQY